jgi:glycosyltransferase involved in cell wall biosynthesis
MDVATLCSTSGEGFPNTLGEAMACGLPCVSTPVGDAPRLAQHAGLVVSKRSPLELKDAWQQLFLSGADGRRALGLRARAHVVEELSLARIARRYEALYEEICQCAE